MILPVVSIGSTTNTRVPSENLSGNLHKEHQQLSEVMHGSNPDAIHRK